MLELIKAYEDALKRILHRNEARLERLVVALEALARRHGQGAS